MKFRPKVNTAPTVIVLVKYDIFFVKVLPSLGTYKIKKSVSSIGEQVLFLDTFIDFEPTNTRG